MERLGRFTHRRAPRLLLTISLGAGLVALSSAAGPVSATRLSPRYGTPPGRPAWESTPSVQAAFLSDSYRPDSTATFVLWERERSFTVQVFRAGELKVPPTFGNTVMQGRPVTQAVKLGPRSAHTPVDLRIGSWSSGLYFARFQAKDRIGFAPFVVSPRKPGVRRVLVVVPTFTWQAYNFRDDDGNGQGDTWYANARLTTARLARPYLARGVPPHFRNYDLPFLQWMNRTGKTVDFYADSDLGATASARDLKRAYDLIIFPGHHEYVTQHEFDLIEGYRNLGGHLMYLSANNFFYKVVRTGNTLTRVARWRDIGRPESALIGVQYIRNDGGAHQGPWVVTNVKRWPWLYGDMGVKIGTRFGNGGIEIDHTTASSPRGTVVIANMPNLMGPGVTAQMSYYETAAGAEVFAAGAFTLGGARNPVSCHLLQHLWDHLSGQRQSTCVACGNPCT